MERIERHDLNMEIAHSIAKRSTCLRKQVGCVITVDNRIVVTGYNGAPAGVPHCTSETCTGPSCSVAVHAEAAAISFAARKGIALENSILYVTYSPCKKCAELILNAGIKQVIYDEPYRDLSGVEFLSNFIKIHSIEKLREYTKLEEGY
jgi:dCMP deaminase